MSEAPATVARQLAAAQGVTLTPAAAETAERMLAAALAAVEQARLARGGSFFDTEPVGFTAALERHAVQGKP